MMVKKILVGIGRPIYQLIFFCLRTIDRCFRAEIKIPKIKLPKFNIPVIKIPKCKWPSIKIKVDKKRLLLVSGIVILLISSGSWWFWQEILRDLPNVNEIYNPPKMSTKIYDRNGELLYKFYSDEDRSWVNLDKIPKEMVVATLAVEDKDFYKHHGLSIKGMLRAGWYNLRNQANGSLRGGSTITQQLAKNVFLSGEKTWRRKIKEAILAVLIETKLSKEEILERYFNQVAYGGETYGVDEAAKKYFGKNIEEIDLAEATFLAGLPAAPSSYLPSGDRLSLAYERQRQVLEQMVIAGNISQEEADKIVANKVNIVPEKKNIVAPHFVFYIRDYLRDSLGFDNIERRGLSVLTSLDKNIQMMTEKIVADEVEKVKRLRISNGAALVSDPRTGEILAMVGSKNYWANDIAGKYNVVTALRQPGSSIKPINYLLALERGKSLSSIIDDAPITYQVPGQKPYSPQNYTGKYLGKVTLKTALASSLNVPSVKLLNENGVENMIDLAEKMGITTWDDRSRFGLSLALGAGEVKMIELAESYTTFSQLGRRTVTNPILEVKNYLGETVYKKNVEKVDVCLPKYAYLINMALSDDYARAPIFGTGSKLKIPGKTVAVKTGTTNNLKDNWCVGWTPEIMVAAWVGNNDGTPMSWVASGISGATPIWNRIITELLKNKKDIGWEIPEGVYKKNVCGNEQYFTDGREKNVTCAPSPSPTPSN